MTNTNFVCLPGLAIDSKHIKGVTSTVSFNESYEPILPQNSTDNLKIKSNLEVSVDFFVNFLVKKANKKGVISLVVETLKIHSMVHALDSSTVVFKDSIFFDSLNEKKQDLLDKRVATILEYFSNVEKAANQSPIKHSSIDLQSEEGQDLEMTKLVASTEEQEEVEFIEITEDDHKKYYSTIEKVKQMFLEVTEPVQYNSVIDFIKFVEIENLVDSSKLEAFKDSVTTTTRQVLQKIFA